MNASVQPVALTGTLTDASQDGATMPNIQKGAFSCAVWLTMSKKMVEDLQVIFADNNVGVLFLVILSFDPNTKMHCSAKFLQQAVSLRNHNLITIDIPARDGGHLQKSSAKFLKMMSIEKHSARLEQCESGHQNHASPGVQFAKLWQPFFCFAKRQEQEGMDSVCHSEQAKIHCRSRHCQKQVAMRLDATACKAVPRESKEGIIWRTVMAFFSLHSGDLPESCFQRHHVCFEEDFTCARRSPCSKSESEGFWLNDFKSVHVCWREKWVPDWGSMFKDAADVHVAHGVQVLLGRTATTIGHSSEKSQALERTLSHGGHMVLHRWHSKQCLCICINSLEDNGNFVPLAWDWHTVPP